MSGRKLWRLMFGLAILFGSIVGFALGLTGGGGGIFAVPLLVYGLAIAPREAIGISLASVGSTALFGAVPRFVRGEIEVRTGLLFAIAGMLGAPIGTYLSKLVPDNILLVLFAILMLIVAQRMWSKADSPARSRDACQPANTQPANTQPANTRTANTADSDRNACQRDADGKLRLTSRCARLLAIVGLLMGILSGMFGVGGGFVIVPALVLFSGMAIHQAVGTSLFVIVLVSISGVASHIARGNDLSIDITLLFMLGGFGGMWLGGIVAKRMQGTTLQRTFSVAVVLVAIFVIFKSVVL